MPTTIPLSLAVLVLLPVVALVATAWVGLTFRLKRIESEAQRALDEKRAAETARDDALVAAAKDRGLAERREADALHAEAVQAQLLAAGEALRAEAIDANARRMGVQALIGSVVKQRTELMALYQRMLSETSNAQDILWKEIDLLCRVTGRKPSPAVAAVMAAVEGIVREPLPTLTPQGELEAQARALGKPGAVPKAPSAPAAPPAAPPKA